jgi:hypothetical protein
MCNLYFQIKTGGRSLRLMIKSVNDAAERIYLKIKSKGCNLTLEILLLTCNNYIMQVIYGMAEYRIFSL